MVGRNHIDRAVRKSLYDCHAILFSAERRVHLGVGAVETHGVIGQREVVRCRLGVDPHAALLCAAHKLDRLFCADMLNHNRRACLPREAAVPLDHHNLRLPVRTRQAEALRGGTAVHTRLFHESRVLLVEGERQL